jgi:hypothetical protein
VSAQSGCTGQCPVVHQTVSGAPGWRPSTCCSRDFVGGVRLKFTGLSGGAPDCPVSQRSAGPTIGRAIRAGHMAEPTARREHRTVRCAPDSVQCANGSQAPTVGFAKSGKKSTPDSVRWCTGHVRCASRQKARIAFLDCSQRLLAALGL